MHYRYTPEYDATVSIQPDGFASFPSFGDLKLGGLTLDQARSAVLAKAAERLNDPEITIDLKNFEFPSFIVGGEVGKPGRFDFRGQVTALRAIQIAGGLKESSKASQVLLIRRVNDVDAQTRLINLKKIVDSADIREDVALQAGDLLIVPKTRISKIEPYLKWANLSAYGIYLPVTF